MKSPEFNKISNSASLSGDKVTIGTDTVYKVCRTDPARFTLNVQKQKRWENQFITAVEIVDEGPGWIEMPFVKNEGLSLWGEKKLVRYLEDAFDRSLALPFDRLAWERKIDEVESKIEDIGVRAILDFLRNLRFSNFFYYGNYHGDLTLDNLIFHNKQVFAIDFLSSFIYSPIHDLVKLRQSTFHNWSGKANKRLDQKLLDIIKQDDTLSEYYPAFQILSLCRIIPYAKDLETINYLKTEINGQFNNAYSGGSRS